MKKFTLSLISILLAGCEVDIEKDIFLSELLNNPISTQNATLRVEVPSCYDFNDSRKPSKSLIDAQAKVPTIFKNAVFKECYSAQFKSFATFDFPIGVGRYVPDEKPKIENEINIISSPARDLVLSVNAKKAFRQQVQDLRNNSMFSNFSFSISLNVKNDLSDTQNIRILSSFIDGEPFVSSNSAMPANSVTKITLSDVSVNQMLTLSEQGGGVDVIYQIKQ